MGKGIERCEKKNIELPPKGNTGSVDIVEGNFESAQKISVNTPHRGHGHSPALDRLTEVEREACQGWYDVMVGPNFNLSPAKADAEAMKLLLKTSRLLKINQAAQDYKLDGYIKIFSTKLNRNIYLAKDERAKRRVPDKTLQVFLESEIQSLNGLSPDELTLMLEAKAMFNFNGVIEDGGQNEK